ncbi:response regulator [Ancylobacter sp. 6x-1]|uniref:Response regulator n=1 Tax=Ancylobacter crimeensis TaxID=2579147 RepID=A0ABT0D8X5_9HYPH|nr:response regulator [Ancylobacter crimeensis]MCK0196392.1 response regulator [Ancylobacter crimeensis]
MSAPERSLEGSRIFILEDESLVSMMIEAMVEELGAIVVASHTQLKAAMDFVASNHSEIDVAVLDVNLGGTRSYAVADVLRNHGAPFVFSTGYDDGSIPPEWLGYPRVRKPFQLDELADALKTALNSPKA